MEQLVREWAATPRGSRPRPRRSGRGRWAATWARAGTSADRPRPVSYRWAGPRELEGGDNAGLIAAIGWELTGNY